MINKKLLTILIVLIAVLSISHISAADVDEDTVLEISSKEVVFEAISDDNVLSANTIPVPAGATGEEIQAIFDEASEGDTISFSRNAVYDLGTFTGSKDNGIQVEKSLTILGNNATITVGEKINSLDYFGGLSIDGREGDIVGTSVSNLNIRLTNVEPWQGYGISIFKGENVTIENCTFYNGANSVTVRGNTVGNVIIRGCTFYGSADESSLGNKKETGVKAINIMGGSGVYVYNNYFNEGLLDGVSIASNAANAIVSGNTFYKNWYGVYYGGGVNNVTTEDNTFICCKIYSMSLMKSAGDSVIKNNEFTLHDNTYGIYIEQNNTAHGYPSEIKDITINGNRFTSCSDSSAGKITVVKTYAPDDMLNPAGSIIITGNKYGDGMTLYSFKRGEDNYTINTDKGSYNNGTTTNIIVTDNSIIEESKKVIIIGSNATIATKMGNRFEIQLKDSDNKLLAGEKVNITVNGVTYTKTTNANGKAGLNINLNMGKQPVVVTYTDSNGVVTKETFMMTVIQAKTQILSNVTTISKKGQRFTAKIVDEKGNGLEGLGVIFHINGVKYYRLTDANGEFRININLQTGLVYNMFMSFDGTYTYEACTGGSQITTAY